MLVILSLNLIKKDIYISLVSMVKMFAGTNICMFFLLMKYSKRNKSLVNSYCITVNICMSTSLRAVSHVQC